MLKWENLKSSSKYIFVARAKVPGGWLITVSCPEGAGLTFYPDPNHEWDGSSLD